MRCRCSLSGLSPTSWRHEGGSRLEPAQRRRPVRRVLRPRVWVALAAAAMLVVAVGSLRSGGTRPERVDSTVSGPEASGQTTIAGVSSSPSSSSSVEAPSTIGTASPAIPTPDRLAVLDPQPGVAPIRSDPILDWVHGTATSGPRRWFLRRSADGIPSGGVAVSEPVVTEWYRTFHDAPSAGIAGVDARIVVDGTTAQVAWLTGQGVRVIAGVGDVDVNETIDIARSAVSVDQLARHRRTRRLPGGRRANRHGNGPLPGHAGDDLAGNRRPAADVDAAAVAFMTPGRDGPIAPLPARRGGPRRRSVVIPPSSSPSARTPSRPLSGSRAPTSRALAPHVKVVPAEQIAIANPENTHGIPPDARRTYGQIERGRWAVYQYSTDGLQCISIDASWGGSGGCSPPGHSDCPVANPTGGPDRVTGLRGLRAVPDGRSGGVPGRSTRRAHRRARTRLHLRLRTRADREPHHPGHHQRAARLLSSPPAALTAAVSAG